MTEYLTEEKLVNFCFKEIDDTGVRNKKFLDYRFRPDFVSYKKETNSRV